MCCAEVCLMEVDGGHCDGNVLAWHFDRHTEQCRNFTYSGCGGNNNRFVTEEECVSQCLWITAEGNHTISTAPVHLWGWHRNSVSGPRPWGSLQSGSWLTGAVNGTVHRSGDHRCLIFILAWDSGLACRPLPARGPALATDGHGSGVWLTRLGTTWELCTLYHAYWHKNIVIAYC